MATTICRNGLNKVLPGLSIAVLGAVLSSAFASPEHAAGRHIAADLQSVADNGGTVVAVGGASTVIVSQDQGKSWSPVALATNAPASLIDVAACPDHSFAALDFYRGVWLGDASGKQWKRIGLPGDSTPMAIACSPANGLWVVGSYTTILSSTDHGASWQKKDLGEDAIFTSIQFVDAQTVMVEGEFGYLLRSRDGGGSWEVLPKVPNDFYAFDGHFKDQNEGWLTGRGGNILHTTDGGQSWAAETPPIPGVPLYRFAAGSGETLAAVGELGIVAERIDQKWQLAHARPLGGYLRGAIFTALGRDLLVVGGAGADTPAIVSAQ